MVLDNFNIEKHYFRPGLLQGQSKIYDPEIIKNEIKENEWLKKKLKNSVKTLTVLEGGAGEGDSAIPFHETLRNSFPSIEIRYICGDNEYSKDKSCFTRLEKKVREKLENAGLRVSTIYWNLKNTNIEIMGDIAKFRGVFQYLTPVEQEFALKLLMPSIRHAAWFYEPIWRECMLVTPGFQELTSKIISIGTQSSIIKDFLVVNHLKRAGKIHGKVDFKKVTSKFRSNISHHVIKYYSDLLINNAVKTAELTANSSKREEIHDLINSWKSHLNSPGLFIQLVFVHGMIRIEIV